jgi:flagellar hook-length control protein FliK
VPEIEESEATDPVAPLDAPTTPQQIAVVPKAEIEVAGGSDPQALTLAASGLPLPVDTAETGGQAPTELVAPPAVALPETADAVQAIPGQSATGSETAAQATNGEPKSATGALAPPPAPRLRDVMEGAASTSSDDQQASSNGTQGSAANPEVSKSSGPATSPVAATESASGRKPDLEGPAVTPVTSDASDPLPQQPSGTPASAHSGPATSASSQVLSTLSHAAMEATAQIAAQIIRKLEGRSTRFEMALTPDELGRVDVSMDIDADGQLSARLAFDNPLAAADLRGRVDELRRQLTDAGFTVADDGLSFDQREPSAGNRGGSDRHADRDPARAFGAASRLSFEADATLVPARWMSLTLTPERVDMKV